MERLLIFDQQVGQLAGTDGHAYRVQHLQDLGLTHPASEVQGQDPGSHPRPKLALVACWQLGQIRLLVARGVVFLFAEPDGVRAKLKVLHHHFLVAAFPARRQAAVLDRP
jgi:hypothetical protein